MNFRSFRDLSKLAAFGLLAGLVLGWAQNIAPFFDAFSHFRLHLCGMLVVVMLALLWQRCWLLLAASAASIALSLWFSVPFLPNWNLPEQSAEKSDLTVVQYNMYFDNRDTETALQSLLSENADVYLVQELNWRNFDIFKGLLATHPHNVQCIGPFRAGSVGIASRVPFDPDFEPVCERHDGFAIARLLTPDKPIAVATLHLRWPWPATQHAQVDELSRLMPLLPDGPVVIAGDFNASPWSNIVHRVAELSKTTIVPGVKLSWEPRFPWIHIPIGLTLPIDQIMSRGVTPVSRRAMPFAGADHRPVITRFTLQP